MKTKANFETENAQQQAGQVINPENQAMTMDKESKLPPLPGDEPKQENDTQTKTRSAFETSENLLPPIDEVERARLQERLKLLRITSKTEVEPDIPLVWRIESQDERVPLFATKNIHMIFAKPKRGKSTLVRFVICLVLLAKQLLGFLSSSDKPEKVVLIDTEHSPSDTKKIIERIALQTELTPEQIDENLWIHHALNEAQKDLLNQLMILLETLHPRLIVLDGCAPFVKSFNNEEECDLFIRQLRALSEKYNASIIAVLHTTKQPDTDLPKGHLGSMLAQFSSTVGLCEKIGTGFRFKDFGSRHLTFSDFNFNLNKQCLICDATQIVEELQKQKAEEKKRKKEEQDQKKAKELQAWARVTIKDAGGSIAKKDFLEQLCVKLERKESRNCYTDFNALVSNGVICETSDKKVQLPAEAG